MERVRIFISSPGDVAEERQRCLAVVEQLQAEFSNQLLLEPLLWEQEPLLASADFQSQIRSPADFDIFVNILCSRLGSPLGPQFTRDDGSTYASGTEFEFEVAVASHRESGKPELLFYRKQPSQQAPQTDQQRQVEAFLARWFHATDDGDSLGDYHCFTDTAEFEALFTGHLRQCLRRFLPRPNNLPAPISSFVGRSGLIAQIASLLVAEHARLVNLVGKKGVGKSRLALRTCRNLVPDFQHGLFLVELRGIEGESQVIEAIAGALDEALPGDEASRDNLVRLLADRALLLFLDNPDDVGDIAALLTALLDGCPGLSLLVACRDALPLATAVVIDVPPLGLPTPGELSVDDIRRSEAVQLFTERARSVRDTFILDADNAQDVLQICRELSGNPQAIELATSRMRSMNAAKLLRSLASIKVKDETGQTVYLVPR